MRVTTTSPRGSGQSVPLQSVVPLKTDQIKPSIIHSSSFLSTRRHFIPHTCFTAESDQGRQMVPSRRAVTSRQRLSAMLVVPSD